MFWIICFLTILSSPVACLLIFSMAYFGELNSLILMESNLSFFSFMVSVT